MAESLQRGELTPGETLAWAEERLALTVDSDREFDQETLHTLHELHDASRR
ncbi:MAG TPA: hypothetical protein VKR79_01595 [Gaiellaceae bacterium]|nr:hypothetical protein [Gaiellaceae bacterium]